jgi:hypothetical protein
MKNLLVGLLLLAQVATQSGGLTIRGRVIHESAAPCPTTGGGGTPCNASQGIYLSSNGRVIQSTSLNSRDGTFLFRDLRPGRYVVTLEPNDAGLPPAEVVLTDKNIDDLQLRIPSSLLHGTLSVEGNGPLPSIRLVLHSMTRGAGSRTYSVQNPTFSFSQIPIGVYGIEVQNLPAGYSVKSITAGASNLLLEKLGLTEANPPQISIVLAVASQSR